MRCPHCGDNEMRMVMHTSTDGTYRNGLDPDDPDVIRHWYCPNCDNGICEVCA